MKINLKEMLFFGAGACIGASASYVFLKKRYEKLDEVIDETDKAIADEIAAARERRMQGIGRPAPNLLDRGGEGVVPKRGMRRDVIKLYEADTDVREAFDEEELDSLRDQEEYLRYEDISSRYCGDRPYVISAEQFSEENAHFDKISLTYYEDDCTLADEGDEIVTDVDETVGRENLDKFGELSDDPEVVYVRNEKIAVDYEIIRLSKSYSDTVMGRGVDDE